MHILGTLAILLLAQQGLADKFGYVIAPSVLKFNAIEDVVIGFYGTGSKLNYRVWLVNTRNKIFSKQTGRVQDEGNPSNTTVLVTEDDLVDDTSTDKPRTVKLCATVGSMSLVCKRLVIDYRTGYLVLQTDKPVYTPNQKVGLRVAAVDESMKPFKPANESQLSFEIISPSNTTLGRKKVLADTTGFSKHYFNLPPYPEIGVWTARVQRTGQFETEGTAAFQVMEYVLPTYEVYVDHPGSKVLLPSTKNHTVTIKAMYVYGRPVIGKASLQFNITDDMGASQKLKTKLEKSITNGFTDFIIPISEMLNDLVGFPENSHLTIQATVIESATGKKEEVLDDKLLFATQLYKISFARSRSTFHRKDTYHVKIDLLTIDGSLEMNPHNVMIYRLENGKHVDTKNITTINGKILAIFQAPDFPTMEFQAYVHGAEENKSDIHTVYAFKGKAMVHVDTVTRENKLSLEVNSNLKQNTKILFLGITRGKIVEKLVMETTSSGSLSEILSDQLKNDLSPRGRFVVMGVSRDDKTLVADSMKIDLTAKCKGNGLHLRPKRPQYLPGDPMSLDITGDPYMYVGLNGIDKAILALDRENILKTDRLFQELKVHDRGCGQGGGTTSGEVLKNAGLTILTNAYIDETEPSSPSDPECENSKRRRKRETNHCKGIDPFCCEYGIAYADEVLYNTEDIVRMHASSKCHAKAYNMTKHMLNLPTKCIIAFYRSCLDQMDSEISDTTQLSGRSLDTQSQYEIDLKPFGKTPMARSDFRESILFEEEIIQLNSEGNGEKIVSFPESITTWYLQALGITTSGTMCIAEPKEVIVMKDFFIQLDVPYTVKRLEQFEIKATVFNYRETTGEMQVNMYMAATDGLCYGDRPGRPSPQMTIEIGGNDAKSVRIPAIPLKAKPFYVTLTAVVTKGSNIMMDSIKREIIVESEGIQVRETFQVCISGTKQLKDNNQPMDCVDSIDRIETNRDGDEQTSTISLTLPSYAIHGTGVATGYIQGTTMADVVSAVIEGTDSLFGRKPSGCGEQTISATTPNVFGLIYLKSTKQMTDTAETNGTANIRRGIDREISLFRNEDSSYSCYTTRYTSTYESRASICYWRNFSTKVIGGGEENIEKVTVVNHHRLTAYVMKVFCHAKKVLDDVLDEQVDILRTLKWLVGQQKNGIFSESGYRFMQKDDDRHLTAYVLIDLLECEVYQKEINSSVQAATKYLEGTDEEWLENNRLGHALIAYAFALAKSPKRTTVLDKLLSYKEESDITGTIHWEDGKSGPNAHNVETTAYALLTMLQFDKLEISARIVRWLTMVQNPHGGFYSTQSTAIALQALSTYAIRTHDPFVDIKVSLFATGWQSPEYKLTQDNRNRQIIVNKLPIDQGNSSMTLIAKVKGGSGKMKVELVYYKLPENEGCAFNVSDIKILDIAMEDVDVNIAQQRQCDVCGYCAGDPNPEDVDFNALRTTTSPTIIDSKIGRKKRSTEDGVEKCMKFSVSSSTQDIYGMSIVKVGLQTGVSVKKDDLEKLMKINKNIFLYETPESREGYVVFYLLTLNSTLNEFTFRVEDAYNKTLQVSTARQPTMVEVYDYYNDEKNCRKWYGIDGEKKTNFYQSCNENDQACSCVRSICANDIDAKLRKMLRSKGRPKDILLKYACDPSKADYATVVQIKKVYRDNDTEERMADGKILNPYHQGSHELVKEQTMVFTWPSICNFPNLRENGKYIIIGKDGNYVRKADKQELRFPLSESTLIIEKKQQPTPGNKALNKLLSKFGNELRDEGCGKYE